MLVTRKKVIELNERLKLLEIENETLKMKVSALDNNVEGLKHDFLLKICSNSVMKEEYNFKLLMHLFEKLDIEKPKSEYKFVR